MLLKSFIESMFVEINKDQIDKDRHVITGVVYIPSDTDIDLFNSYMTEILDKVEYKSKFFTYLYDYNMSLLNAETHDHTHDDVIKWKHLPCYWSFVRGIHRSPVNSPHKGQWRGALMFSLICAWIKVE